MCGALLTSSENVHHALATAAFQLAGPFLFLWRF